MTGVDWGSLSHGVLDEIFAETPSGPDFGDRYELRGELGRGGQGVVHRAWDRHLEREVAIKRLRDPGRDQRVLLEEARLLARLAHPAVPQVYDRGRSPDGGAYVVMQLVEGQRLDVAVDALPPDPAPRLRLLRGVIAAVAHAHRHGILHRDLKPENIVVDAEGQPYLLDWGLAAIGGPRAVCGSPHFAAPEQLDGQPADRRADIYALGVLLYFVLTGELPYGRAVRDFHEFRRSRAALARVSLRARRPDLPAALEALVERASAAQPGARFADCDALLAALDGVTAGGGRVRPAIVLAVTAATSLLSLSLGWMLAHAGGPGAQPEPLRLGTGRALPAAEMDEVQAPQVESDFPWQQREGDVGDTSDAAAVAGALVDQSQGLIWPAAEEPVADPASTVDQSSRHDDGGATLADPAQLARYLHDLLDALEADVPESGRRQDGSAVTEAKAADDAGGGPPLEVP